MESSVALLNATTTGRLIFRPFPGRTDNTRNASIGEGHPVRVQRTRDGWKLFASLDSTDDYYRTAEPSEFELVEESAAAVDAELKEMLSGMGNVVSLAGRHRSPRGFKADADTPELFGVRHSTTIPAELGGTVHVGAYWHREEGFTIGLDGGNDGGKATFTVGEARQLLAALTLAIDDVEQATF